MTVLVVSPHPDDETLGCGGSLLRHSHEGDDIYWLNITSISERYGWKQDDVEKRKNQISKINEKYAFKEFYNLDFPTTKVDSIPINEIIQKISNVHEKVKAEIVYMPYIYDVHTDHQIVAKAMQSTLKWFRYSHIKKVLMYETLSETEFNFIEQRKFNPNTFIDISKFLDKKIELMKIYSSEIGEHPFPRSENIIRSLASLRGSQSGYLAAEAFELVYQRK